MSSAETAAPTLLLGLEGVVTATRTPMWASPVLGDSERRMIVPRAEGAFERVTDHAWLCPVTASAFDVPLPIVYGRGHGCLVLDREDVERLRAPSEGSSNAVGAFLRALSGAEVSRLPIGHMGDMVVWYCAPEEAFDVRVRLREAWWERAVRFAQSMRVMRDEDRDKTRSLAFRVQRCAARRVEWAYAVALLEVAREEKLARTLRETAERDVSHASFQSVYVAAEAELRRRPVGSLRAYGRRARDGQRLDKRAA